MTDEKQDPMGQTIELLAARQAASELMLRALFHLHPHKNEVQTYLERMVGQTLAQPHFVLNKNYSEAMKSAVQGMLAPGPTEG